MTGLICLWLYCFNIITLPNINAEQFLNQATIKYRLGWNWPNYYDCGGILTQALKQEWYIWPKITSHTTRCRIPNHQATYWDILVNTNTGQRHVALITSDYHNNKVQILDFVDHYTNASYRIHSLYRWVYVLDTRCLLQIYQWQDY